MKVHVDVAESEMAKVMRVQKKALEKLHAAEQAQDLTRLEEAVKYANGFDTLRGPVMQPDLKHEALQGAEKTLESLLKDEAAFKKKLDAIENIEFEEASIDSLEKTLGKARASPATRRLHTDVASTRIKVLKARREELESKLDKLIARAEHYLSADNINSKDPSMTREERIEQARYTNPNPNPIISPSPSPNPNIVTLIIILILILIS